MRLVIEFDCDADIIDVPEFVIENKDILQRRFWKWLSNKSIKINIGKPGRIKMVEST